jgi:hypothetical protein
MNIDEFVIGYLSKLKGIQDKKKGLTQQEHEFYRLGLASARETEERLTAIRAAAPLRYDAVDGLWYLGDKVVDGGKKDAQSNSKLLRTTPSKGDTGSKTSGSGLVVDLGDLFS